MISLSMSSNVHNEILTDDHLNDAKILGTSLANVRKQSKHNVVKNVMMSCNLSFVSLFN